MMTVSRRNFMTGALLASATSGRAQEPAADHRIVAFPSGGQQVAAVLFSPPPRDGPMRGAGIMLLNGSGGTDNDLPRFRRDAVAMTRRGYVVVMPNYLGATPQPDPGNRARWTEVITDCADWMTSQGVQPGRVALMGFSLGGALAVETAVTRPGFRCAVGIASGGGLDPSAITHRPPVLLIYADADPVVPPSATRAWERRLKEGGVPVRTQVLDTSNHVFEPPEWRDIFSRGERFARPHLA